MVLVVLVPSLVALLFTTLYSVTFAPLTPAGPDLSWPLTANRCPATTDARVDFAVSEVAETGANFSSAPPMCPFCGTSWLSVAPRPHVWLLELHVPLPIAPVRTAYVVLNAPFASLLTVLACETSQAFSAWLGSSELHSATKTSWLA